MSTVSKDSIAKALAFHDSHLSFAVTLMEHLVVPTFVLDADRRVLIWNRACERLTDIPASEVVGTSEHWRAFYETPRPCLADLVATGEYQQIADLYTVFENPAEPSFGVHAENWCWMPGRRQRLYLAVDAGPVYDESGKLIAVALTLRDITEKHVAQTKVQEQASLLKAHYDEHQRETELARRILEHQIRADLMLDAGVQYSVTAASNFSGDMVLAARSPSGRLYAILADATGHGLSAAVSVLPMVQEFYRMVELSAPLSAVIESINFLLANSLPLGRFVAAAFISLDEQRCEGEVWVGGVPDVLMFDDAGHLERRFPSNNLPLGIMRSSDGVRGVERFSWHAPRHLLLLSDGVIEASLGESGDFGEARVIAALAQRQADESFIDAVRRSLQGHLQGGAAHDDMSLLLIDCPAAKV